MTKQALHFLTTLFAASLIFTACSKTPEGEEMRKEVSEAADAVGEWTEAKKDEFLRKYGDELEAMEQGAEKGLALFAAAGEEAGEAAVAAWEKLDDDIASAGVELEKLGNTANDKWDEASAAFEERIKDIKAEYDELMKGEGGPEQ